MRLVLAIVQARVKLTACSCYTGNRPTRYQRRDTEEEKDDTKAIANDVFLSKLVVEHGVIHFTSSSAAAHVYVLLTADKDPMNEQILGRKKPNSMNRSEARHIISRRRVSIGLRDHS